MTSPHAETIGVLRSSQTRLEEVAAALDDDALVAASYCADWTVAQVLSHLGSGAEIATMNLAAIREGRPAPERSEYEAVWAIWNARPPREMADESLLANRAHLAALESIGDEELETLRIPAFGGRILDVSGAVVMRLGEHAIHTWDVAVSRDQSALVLDAAVALLVDAASERVQRLARGERPAAAPIVLGVETSGPKRQMTFSIDEEVEATEVPETPGAHLEITAEAFVRLVYGRLDEAHTPASTTISGALSLADLRSLFPGF